MNTALSCLSFRNVQFDVVDQHGQPWLRSQQISVALGYGRSDQVNDLYARNADEFTDAMTALVKLPDLQQGSSGTGQMREVRIFSLRGCHLLGMFARTAIAKEFRKWVLDVLDQQSAFNAHPDLDAVHHLAASMAEEFLGYLTDEIANGPQALAELPVLQQAVARALDQRDTQRLQGKVLVDYSMLVDLANTAYALRHMVGLVETYATRIEQQIGQPLLKRQGDLRPPTPTPDATADYRARVARFVAQRHSVTVNVVIEGLGETPNAGLRTRTAYALHLLGWRKDYGRSGSGNVWFAPASRAA